MNMIFLEDDLLIRSNYIDYLKKIFKNVYEASNVLEAMDIYESKNIDFILADIEMEGKNGIDFIKEIRDTNKEVKIVIMSAYDNKHYLMEAIKLNLLDYLIKPVSRLSFQNIILRVIEELKNKERIFLKNNYVWDKKNKKLFLGNDEVILTKNEMILFNEFCSQNERIFTFEEVSELIYPAEEYNINKIRMLIKRLKKKLNYDNNLENIHNIGYRFKLE